MTAAPQPLLLLGAGGFARETAETVRAINAVRPTWSLLGFLDDDPAKHGTDVMGVPVLGPMDLAHDRPDARVVICAGRPDNYVSRFRIARRLELDDARFACIVHPSCSIGESCTVGPGTVLLAQVVLTADVTVGRHVAVMPQVVVTHDARVDDFATLSAGVRLGGGCHIGEGAYVGSAACVRENRTVGSWAMLGMASVVTRDVPANRLWYGSPAHDAGHAPLPGKHAIAARGRAA